MVKAAGIEVQVVPGGARVRARKPGEAGTDGGGFDYFLENDGGDYRQGCCIGVDDGGGMFLLMTIRGEVDEDSMHCRQVMKVLSPAGVLLASMELPQWRDDLWWTDGGNIRVLGNGDVCQLWSRGQQVFLRSWTRQ